MQEEPTTSPPAAAEESPAIFVVDDEVIVGEVVEVILKVEGFNPVFFSNPEAAYQAFLKADPKPSLLLTDYLMSPINGMELIQLCKEAAPDLRTILYSGNVREEILQFYNVKPDAFLGKPFLPKALICMVQDVLAH